MHAGVHESPLTRSVEDYLKVIYHLSSQGGFAATSDIAAQLDVSAPSVSGMVKRLSETGFIEHVPYRGVQLTAQGRRAALKMALSSKLADGQLVVLEDYPFSAPKTKEFMQVMKKFDLEKALFITSEGHEALELSARNVPYVQVMPTAGLNVYDILRYDHLVLLSPAVAAIEARLTA